MVKNKNYNHPEIGILTEDDLHRMKVRWIQYRKQSVNPQKKSSSKKGSSKRKKNNINCP
jgi:hypothetical protein